LKSDVRQELVNIVKNIELIRNEISDPEAQGYLFNAQHQISCYLKKEEISRSQK